MTAYTFRQAGAWAHTTTGTVTPTLGTESTHWDAGNLALAFVMTRLGTETVTAPGGWTLLATSTTGNVNLYGRILQAGDTDPVFTLSGTTAHDAQIAIFSGDVWSPVSTIVAHSAVLTDTSVSDFRYTGLTITTDDCLVLICGQKVKTATSNGTTVDAEPGFTEIGETGIAGTQVFAVWNYVQQTTAANITAGTWSQTGTTEAATNRGFTLALKSLAASTAAPSLFTVRSAIRLGS